MKSIRLKLFGTEKEEILEIRKGVTGKDIGKQSELLVGLDFDLVTVNQSGLKEMLNLDQPIEDYLHKDHQEIITTATDCVD